MYGRFLTRVAGCFLLVWLGASCFMLSSMWKSDSGEVRLRQAYEQILKLKEENNRLEVVVAALQGQGVAGEEGKTSGAFCRPSKEYEETRRQIKRDVKEMGNFMRHQFEVLLSSSAKGPPLPPETATSLRSWLAQFQHRRNSILAALWRLEENDGYNAWRQKEAKELRDLMEKRLHFLQNPEDCSKAKKLVCNLDKPCGFGCQVHHAIYCFIVAYGTERTLVLKSKGWSYNKKGFEYVFKPLSNTCSIDSIKDNERAVKWPGEPDSPVVELPPVDSVRPRPKFLPPAIPADLADRLLALHGNPVVWWTSEFLRYFLKPQQSTLEVMTVVKNHSIPAAGDPYVGIHIRRTDKVVAEAAFHGVKEYMELVEDYFQMLEIKVGHPLAKKYVYIATDDPKALADCRSKYPDYTFYGDEKNAKLARTWSRYSPGSLLGLITDIYRLANSDFLVCTFSSQVCRLAYEIQQQRFVDGADRYRSLDDIWYFGGQSEHRQEAVMSHVAEASGEIDLEKGDVIQIAGNHWNGFNKGKLLSGGKSGLYPEYKVKEKPLIVEFPSYSNVEL